MAARRIAINLAEMRTGEEQPSPSVYRQARRDVIRQCIYGVDLNPLAVELCKVALWLEAHVPGEPLSFLDHHIKCGNAIIGFANFDDLDRGVPTEAFKTLDGDEKETAAAYRNTNKRDRKEIRQRTFAPFVDAPISQGLLNVILEDWKTLSALPEATPNEIDKKRKRYADFAKSEAAEFLRSIADIPIAQFYTRKVPANKEKFVTDVEFRNYWHGEHVPQGEGVSAARDQGENKRFFHWFLEFPEIIEHGGFNCILGNPPYLGDKKMSGTYGYQFCECVRWLYEPVGLSELVVYFLRRINELLCKDKFAAVITTNSIKDGKIRRDGLDQIIKTGGQINMAVRAIKWPGAANLIVSLLSFHNGPWDGLKMLDGLPVKQINSFFEEEITQDDPKILLENRDRVLTGYFFLGDGFFLTHEEAIQMRINDPRNAEVIMPFINGKEINNEPDQASNLSIIYFRDWSIERAKEYSQPFSIVEETVKPYRESQRRMNHKKHWWIYGENRSKLSRALQFLNQCFAIAQTTKYLSFSSFPTNYIISQSCYVFTSDRWDLFAVVQSTLHDIWARKYGGSLGQGFRYLPSKCFVTFAFPVGLWKSPDSELAELGELCHSHRWKLMQSLWLGLTKIYNLFHSKTLTPDLIAKTSKKNNETATAGYDALLELRRLHFEMDLAVCNAYGWQDLDLEYDFHEIEYLPENDRTRFTISSSARREVLQRLLVENHSRAKSETNVDLFKQQQ